MRSVGFGHYKLLYRTVERVVLRMTVRCFLLVKLEESSFHVRILCALMGTLQKVLTAGLAVLQWI